MYSVRVQSNTGTQGEYLLNVGNPLTVTIPANATEGDGTVAGTVSISSALGTDLLINLVSSNTDRATVPASVTILAGQTSATLPIAINDNNLLDGIEPVTMTAMAADYTSGTDTIAIHDNETAVLTVNLPTSAPETPGVLSGLLSSGQAPTRAITVQLASNDVLHLTVPVTIILPAGQTTVGFNVTLLDDHIIEAGPTPVTVTAQVENWTSGSATIDLMDDDRTMTVIMPVSGWEGQALSGTVQLGGILATPLVVSLASDDTTELTLPPTVTIPAGQMSATFNVTLVANGLRTGPKTVQVMATAADLPTATDNMIVNDSDVDHYTFTTISSPKLAGTPFSVTARIRHPEQYHYRLQRGGNTQRHWCNRIAAGHACVRYVCLRRMDWECNRRYCGSQCDIAVD